MTDCAVLVNTWDGYSEAWPMMAHGLKKYWSDMPFKLFWLCNHKDPPLGIPIKTDNVTIWSFMMREALIRLMAEGFDYFCFCHEDMWITGKPNTTFLKYLPGAMRIYDVDHIQLVPSWDVMRTGGSWDISYPEIHPDLLHVVDVKSDYRTSNQASLWKTRSYYDILVELMREHRNTPWDFEVHGSQLSEGMLCLSIGPEVSSATWPINYVYRWLDGWGAESIVKGKWTSAAIKYCEREGVPYNFKEGDSVVK